MAVAVEGTPTLYENSATTSAALTYPTGIVAGEVLIALIGTSVVTAPATAPTGWTLTKAQNGDNAISASVFHRVATGSETGTITFTGTSGRTTGIMFRVSGVDTTTIQDAVAVGAGAPVQTTFVMPTITTATAGAMLIHNIVLNASNPATNDIVTLTGTTLLSKSTGTGRITGGYSELRATAGATGTRTWTKTGATALQWAGVTVALKPASGGGGGSTVNAVAATASGSAPSPVVTNGTGPTPTLNRCVQGVPTTTTHTIKVNTTDAGTVRIKAGTNSTLTTGVAWGDAVTPDANSNAQLTISGLTPNTAYFYRIAMTNSVPTESLDTWTDVGQFKTDLDGALTFAFAFGSCTNNTDSASMGAIAVKKPDLFLHLGDEYYADASGTGLANFRTKMGDKKTATNHKAVYRTSGSNMVPSDHDAMNNNGNYAADPTGWTNWNQVYREMNSTDGLPAGGMGTYRTFKRGRVRFIALDRRSFASAAGNTDNSTKTSLGTTQKNWLKNLIDTVTEPVIVIQQGEPWIHGASVGDDGWGGYLTERDELAAYFAASGKNIVMLAGDMHAVAAEDGSGSPGGVPVFQASPLYQNASIKGGPYDVGPYPASGTTVVQQYGWMDVTDTGSQISLVFKGFSSDNTQRVTLTKTYSISTPATVAAVATSATATSSVPVVSGAVTVVGVASTGTAAGVAPALSAAQVITAVRAQGSSLALAPAHSSTGEVVAVRATGSSTALAPAVVGSQTAAVVSPVFVVTSSASAPTVNTIGAVTAALAPASATAFAPGVGAAPTVVHVRATGTAGAVAPSVGAGYGLTAVAATGSSLAVAPSLVAGAAVTAAKSSATSLLRPPSVAAFAGTVVSSPYMVGTSAALVPGVTAPLTVTAVRAQGSSAAVSPVVTGLANVASVNATGTATMRVPGVTAGGVAGVTAVRATGTASASAPTVTIGIIVGAPAMVATSTARTPVVSAIAAVQSTKASATAQALPPVATVVVTIAATQMVATALQRNPSVNAVALVSAVVALATALAHTPKFGGDKEMYLKDGTRVRPYLLIGGILVPVDPFF